MGFLYFFNSSDINPSKGARIRKLADLRNLALKPLLDNKERVSENTTVLFINDVAACPEDILELVLQRRVLDADMTCAMDWTFPGGDDPTFYDIWISRTIKGDSFFKIPSDGSWDLAQDLFWNDDYSRSRFEAKLPFQVFACWNGATAFGAAPLLEGLKFRDPRKDECFQGEPQIFCKEMWWKGYRKIAVIPTINLEYTDEQAARLKSLKGFTSELVQDQTEEEAKIDWNLEPPKKVKCMPMWTNQFWRPWNETLH